ncbi:hypothetical protein SCA03_03150 [Streptomyces cacaoi]|uniref:Uncharacterized protein n=1 Tax=Streptomyces cacaoi TaxID=1898 RepID=A0A4Y3QQV6_STRCI|nr:hypothetical protein SCA03_03150 [Streptomyces cacaoi]
MCAALRAARVASGTGDRAAVPPREAAAGATGSGADNAGGSCAGRLLPPW